jgi:prophage tail gpP-like protein
MSINRGIDAVCGSFELGITIREKTGGVVFPVKTGMSCQVTLGGVPQVTGRIDSVSRSLSAEDWSIKIAGRDKAADLADCSAINSPGSWSNAKLETIAKAIAAPFGISIDVAAGTGAAFRNSRFSKARRLGLRSSGWRAIAA